MNKLIVFSLLCFLTRSVYAQELKVVDLTCQYQVNPTGLEVQNPALSWKLQSTQNNVVQIAYQVLVAESLSDLNKNLGTIWNSKKVSTDQSIQVKFQGKRLSSGKTYFWKVKVWDNKNNAAWSTASKWQMGLLTPEDWKGADWIAYEKLADSNVNVLPTDGKKDKYTGSNVLPLFRKEFKVTKTIKSATLFIAGLGHFEASLNGQKIGDHFLDAGWTKYDKQALYLTFDVTKQLIKGDNALGVMLGNGFYYVPPVKNRYRKLKVAYGYPKMICKLNIEYSDGTTAVINSNETWKTAPSPIIFSSIYGGEDYDATLEQKGWDRIGFNSQDWKTPLSVSGPKLNAQKEEAVKVFENFVARTIQPVANNEWVYDLGQNASGIIELKVKGKRGDTVRIRPAELLKADGTVNQSPAGSPFYFTYILKGDGIETWRPRFTYYGFRYLQVKGALPESKIESNALTPKPIILSLKGLHIRNAAKHVGNFSNSNELFNKTFNLIDWAIKSNMVSVFTDCPQREKLGWLEQLHLMGNSVRYNYDAAPIFRKALEDMKHSQTAEGLIPEIAPEYVKFEWGGDMFRDSPEWGSSGIIMPWYLYQWYGDKQVLINYYPMMQRYIAYLGTKAKNHILLQGLGDWYDLGPNPPGVSQLTPMGVTGTAIYYYDLMILQQIASILDKKEEAKSYQSLAQQVRKSFNQTFFNLETKQYASGSQTANAMAVYMELVEQKDKSAVVENIIKDIKSRNNGLTAGDIGYRYLLRVLEKENHSDVIFEMNSRSDVPGYGMQLAKGATALTESWAGLTTVSNNHFMLGHLMEWFYSGVGGIRQAENSLAFKEIIIHPEIVGDLTWAKASYNCPYGPIATHWVKTPSGLEFSVTIPANTTATVYLPASANQEVSNLGSSSFEVLGFENGRMRIAIGSGTYKFKVKAQQKSNTVGQDVMNKIYQEVKTPYKYGLVMVPKDTLHKMDCPNIFRKGKYWYMTYLIFGGRGYETWLAKSKDLLNWDNLGRIMSFSDTTAWDQNQKAGYNALTNPKWGGNYKLAKFKGKYWMSYFGGKEKGYEVEPLSIGMAYVDQHPSIVQEWKRLPKPVLTSADKDVRWWENRNKLFKSTIIADKERLTGHPFVMYYNAVGDSLPNNKKTRWYERIGMAVSDDMVNWQRFLNDPVVHHPVGITGDAVLQKIDNTWVMFYFGAFWQDRKGAFNRFAASNDLVNWTDWTGENLIESSEPYDELYAHKSFVLKHKGIVYHFYCAVNKNDERGIAVATSKELGKSKISFVGKK